MSTKALRVLIVSPYFAPERTGCASRMGDLAKALVDDGAEVTVLAPHPTFPTGAFPRNWHASRERTEGGVRVVNLWAWQPRAREPSFASRAAYYLSFPIHAAAWTILRAPRFDVVVCTNPPAFTWLVALALKTLSPRKRVVLDVRDLWVDAAVALGFAKKDGFLTRITRAIERRAMRQADAITVVTAGIREKLVAAEPSLATKITVVGNGVDVSRFQPVASTKVPRFVHAGILGAAQDLEVALRAFALVQATHPDSELVFAGDGEERERLTALARELRIEDRVKFLGIVPREEIPQLLSGAVAGIAFVRTDASLDYAIPTKTYEYMACGIPVLARGGAELAAIIERSGAGEFVDGSIEEVAAAMRRLLDDPERAAALGKRGRNHVVEHCDRAVLARRFFTVIDGGTS